MMLSKPAQKKGLELIRVLLELDAHLEGSSLSQDQSFSSEISAKDSSNGI